MGKSLKGMTAKKYRVSLWRDENILGLCLHNSVNILKVVKLYTVNR